MVFGRRLLSLLSLPVLGLALVGAQLALPAAPASASASSSASEGTLFYDAWDDLCVLPTGSSDAAVVQDVSCYSSVNEWYSNVTGSSFQIRNAGYANQCLGVAGGSTSQGAQVVMWRCNGAENQLWNAVHCGGVGTACQYVNASSGLYLSVDGCSNTPGLSINMWGFVPLPGGYCQWWNWA